MDFDFDFDFDFEEKESEESLLLRKIIRDYKDCLNNYPYSFKDFAKNFLLIKTKDAKITPFVLNEWQERTNDFIINQYNSHEFIEVLIVKGRQGGITTFCVGFLLYQALALKNNIAFISDNGKNAQIMFEMSTLMLSKIFELGIEGKGNGHFGKLITLNNFEKTSLRFYSAEGGKVRGGTVGAIFNDELGERTDILEVEGLAKKKGAIHFKNGTPKGTGNNLHLLYTNAKNHNETSKVLFLPWYGLEQYESNKSFEESEDVKNYFEKYGLQDLKQEKKNWFNDKFKEISLNYSNAVEKINQEYPPNIEVGFNATAEGCFCEPSLINKAFIKKDCEKDENNIIIGLDIAGGGDLSTVCIRQKDYCSFQILKHDASRGGLQASEKVEDLKRLIVELVRSKNNYSPSIIVNYDKTGAVGINFDNEIIPMVNFLRVKGYDISCRGVHFNESVITYEHAGERRENARNSIYMNLRKWLLTEKVWIVDKFNQLLEELLATKIITVNGEVKIVSKEKIKKSLGRSPDFADALALCFFPEEKKYKIGSYKYRDATLPIIEDEYR